MFQSCNLIINTNFVLKGHLEVTNFIKTQAKKYRKLLKAKVYTSQAVLKVKRFKESEIARPVSLSALQKQEQYF